MFKANLNKSQQYLLAMGLVSIATIVNFGIEPIMGYWGLGLIYLLAIVIQSLMTERGPVFLSAFVGAALWNFLFIPPKFTLRIHKPEDILLVFVYFVVAIVSGIFATTVSRQKVLEESERLHKLLLSSLSHELRTPIAAIQGALSNLQLKKLEDDSELRVQVIAEIEIANNRLRRLIENLLDMSRLESGYMKPRLEWCDAADLVSTSIRELRERGFKADIKVTVEENLPLIRADFVLFEQILGNLLMNAALHANLHPLIELQVSNKDNEVEFSVSDNGKGLDSELLPIVFEKFVRGSNSGAGGVGLGLAIAKGFVELQGGRIVAANLPGAGAIFRIFMPIAKMPELPQDSNL